MAELTGRILFTSGQAGDTDLWCLDLDTTSLRQLTVGRACNAKGRWSPDGTHVVYVSNEAGPRDLWLMAADGTHHERLTDDGRWHDHPDWSPDGSHIVCTSNREGAEDNEIWTLELRTGKWVRLTECAASDSYPAWAPAGRRIAFTSSRSGNQDVWLFDLVTKDLRQLTDAPGPDFGPAWSPDGTRIAFVAARVASCRDSVRTHPDLDVWVMNADGTRERQVTTSQGTDRCVTWSPDGSCLLYTASKPGGTAERLMTVSPDGAGAAPVAYERGPLEAEIGAEPVGLFSLLPAGIVRRCYPDAYFGTETYPHWIR